METELVKERTLQSTAVEGMGTKTRRTNLVTPQNSKKSQDLEVTDK